MLRILLCCAAGMSTSLLVTKMESYCAREGIKAKIWAVSENAVDHEANHCDIILIGPQIRFRLKSIQRAYGSKIPVEMIPMNVYGRLDGAAVVKLALQTIEDYNNKQQQ